MNKIIILLAVLTRIAIPPIYGHPWNFAAIDAIALFAGATSAKRSDAILLTLFSVWIGDIFLNSFYAGKLVLFYSGFYWQYASYILITLIGCSLKNRITPFSLAGACLSSSVLFFIVSNFGVWFGGMMYPPTLQGLVECYVAAIPFFKNTIISDLFFTAVLFGTFALITRNRTVAFMPRAK